MILVFDLCFSEIVPEELDRDVDAGGRIPLFDRIGVELLRSDTLATGVLTGCFEFLREIGDEDTGDVFWDCEEWEVVVVIVLSKAYLRNLLLDPLPEY